MSAMMKSLGIDRLSVAERIALVQEIWDSIAATPEAVPLTDAEKQELDRRLADLEASPANVVTWHVSSHIRSDPRVMMGKPVIAGTRITVELILDKLAAGETIPQILEAHPALTEEAIRAALAFAAAALRADVVYPVSGTSG